MRKESQHACASPGCRAALLGMDGFPVSAAIKILQNWILTADGKLWCPVHKPKVGVA